MKKTKPKIVVSLSVGTTREPTRPEKMLEKAMKPIKYTK